MVFRFAVPFIKHKIPPSSYFLHEPKSVIDVKCRDSYSKAFSQDLYETDEKRQGVARSIDEKAYEIEGLARHLIKASKEDFLHIEVNNADFYLHDLIVRIQDYYGEKLALIKEA